MMQSAMTAAKQNSQLANIMKLCTALSENQGGSDSDSEEEQEFSLDAETIAKVKASAYEKLAKSKGKTVEELKAEANEMSVSPTAQAFDCLCVCVCLSLCVSFRERQAPRANSLTCSCAFCLGGQAEEKAAMSAELQKIASKAVNRAHIKRTAGMELAASKGYAAACTTTLERSSTLQIFHLCSFSCTLCCPKARAGRACADFCLLHVAPTARRFDGLEELEAHIKTCPAEEKAALLAELNEMATKALERAAPRSGKALWSRAKVMIPVRADIRLRPFLLGLL